MGNKMTDVEVIDELKFLAKQDIHVDMKESFLRAIEVMELIKKIDGLYLEKCREVTELTEALKQANNKLVSSDSVQQIKKDLMELFEKNGYHIEYGVDEELKKTAATMDEDEDLEIE